MSDNKLPHPCLELQHFAFQRNLDRGITPTQSHYSQAIPAVWYNKPTLSDTAHTCNKCEQTR